MNTKQQYICFSVVVLLLLIFLYYSFKNAKEGFVKYYKQTATGKPDYLGNIADGVGAYNVNNVQESQFFKANSEKNIELAFSDVANRDAEERTKLIGRITPLESHKSLIDVAELRNLIKNNIFPKLNAAAKKINADALYDFVQAYDTEVTAWSNGVKKVATSIDVHDKSKNLVTTYTVHMRIVFYVFNNNTYLSSVTFQENKNPDESDGPKPYEDNQIQEQLVNKFHLNFPWYTTEQTTGLITTPEQRNNFYAKRKSKARKNEFYCFGVSPGTDVDGNTMTREECTKRGGVVDAPVYDPTKCPYYKLNKNYPNERGGSKTSGYCEMPLGTQQVSFTRNDPNPAYSPLCYNCKAGESMNGEEGTIGQCCEQQKENLTEYNLLSPDYAFPGDMIDRRQFKSQFKKRGLSWSRFGAQFEDNIPNVKKTIYENRNSN